MLDTNDSELWIPKIMAWTELKNPALDAIIEENPLFDVDIVLVTRDQVPSLLAPSQTLKNFQFDLRSLRDNTGHADVCSSWEFLLDTTCPLSKDPERGDMGPNANVLGIFQVCLGSLRV